MDQSDKSTGLGPWLTAALTVIALGMGFMASRLFDPSYALRIGLAVVGVGCLIAFREVAR